jgi:hypothetical protein
VRSAARCLLLALTIVLLSSPGWFALAFTGITPYLIATALLLAVHVALLVTWERTRPLSAGPPARNFAVAAVVTYLLTAGAHNWIHQLVIFPIDAQRADMLVVVQAGIHRLLQGHDPYTMYNVPWPATLPYGPVMWAPLMLPALAHVDVRFVTLIGVLFVPSLCGGIAINTWRRGRYGESLGWLAVMAAFVISPDVRGFVPIGHTPTYWPLLVLFAVLAARERWDAAAIACGLLIVGRSTMVALAPVVIIAVWHRDRRRTPKTAVLIAAAVVLPFLPFAVWNWNALQYALYGSYQAVIKGFVWASTDWARRTIGVTGFLLAHGWSRAVEIVQAVVLLAVYAASAMAIRAKRSPLPWLAFALFAFSITTLWPVTYIYLDVCVLAIGAAAAEIEWVRPVPAWRPLAIAIALAALVAGASLWVDLSPSPAIDVGTESARSLLYAGFSSDEREGDTTFAWINGTRATMLIARRSRRDAAIDLYCEPNLPRAGSAQQLSASLNGTVIGTVTLTPGWQHVTLAAPGRAWQIGVNELTLFLSSAVSPRELGLSDDGRKLSLAVDRLTVRTP